MKTKSVKIQGFDGVDNKKITVKVLMVDGRKIKVEADARDTIGDIVECIVREIENEH